MKNLVLSAAVAAALATAALGPTGGPAARPGIWWHPSRPGPEPLAAGPTMVINKVRRNGVSNYDQLVGDYSNPILQPWAADVVKKHGELLLAGVPYPNPANECWPEPLPFIYKNFALQLFQKPGEITMLYEQDHEVRHVRM